jgi:hypothetical protein
MEENFTTEKAKVDTLLWLFGGLNRLTEPQYEVIRENNNNRRLSRYLGVIEDSGGLVRGVYVFGETIDDEGFLDEIKERATKTYSFESGYILYFFAM